MLMLPSSNKFYQYALPKAGTIIITLAIIRVANIIP